MHPERSPETLKLIAALADHEVRYVLVGSVAAVLYGVKTEPGDLDIVPDLGRDNLLRPESALSYLEARPSSAIGQWQVQPNGERRWVRENLTAQEIAAFRTAWRLEPDDPGTADHLFTTRYGNLDVVPELAGSYSALKL